MSYRVKGDKQIDINELASLIEGETILSVDDECVYDDDLILEFSLFYIIVVSGSCSGYGCMNYYLREKSRDEIK